MKKNLRPQKQAVTGLSSETAASLSQHSTPVKRPLLRFFDNSPLPQDTANTQPTGMGGNGGLEVGKKGRSWACLLIFLIFGLAAGILAVAMLPVTPRVLPLIY